MCAYVCLYILTPASSRSQTHIYPYLLASLHFSFVVLLVWFIELSFFLHNYSFWFLPHEQARFDFCLALSVIATSFSPFSLHFINIITITIWAYFILVCMFVPQLVCPRLLLLLLQLLLFQYVCIYIYIKNILNIHYILYA